MLNSLQQMNIKFLIELERIKKPSQIAYVTARLVCQFFSAFKDSTPQCTGKQTHMEDLIEWTDVQKFISTQIIKYTSDLLHTIKNKVSNPELLSHLQRDQLELKLFQIRQAFFTGDNLKLFKHVNTNKSFQVVVTFIFNVVFYFLDYQYNDKISSQVNTAQPGEANGQPTESFKESTIEDLKNSMLDRTNYDAQICKNVQGLVQKGSAERTSVKRKSRNQGISKLDTTPTAADKSSRHHPLQNENKEILQKSASRLLLQKRDRSQLVAKEEFQSNKSPKPTISSKENQEQKEGAATKKHNFEQSASRRLIGARQKSLGKSPIQTPKDTVKGLQQKTSEVLSLHDSQQTLSQQQQAVDIKHFTYFPISFNTLIEEEEPLNLNYRLMAETSNLSQIIKDQTAAIEENMRFSGESPMKKQIDMSLIEQIKQRRKEQRLREVNEESKKDLL